MNPQFQLSKDFKRCLRHFVYYFSNGTLNWVAGDGDILKGLDYLNDPDIMESGNMEMIFAIYLNNIRFNDAGEVLNQPHCIKRVAQFIRQQSENVGEYQIEPPLEDWEIVLD